MLIKLLFVAEPLTEEEIQEKEAALEEVCSIILIINEFSPIDAFMVFLPGLWRLVETWL